MVPNIDLCRGTKEIRARHRAKSKIQTETKVKRRAVSFGYRRRGGRARATRMHHPLNHEVALTGGNEPEQAPGPPRAAASGSDLRPVQTRTDAWFLQGVSDSTDLCLFWTWEGTLILILLLFQIILPEAL